MNLRTYFFLAEFLTGICSILRLKHATQVESSDLQPTGLLMKLRASMDQCSPERAMTMSAADRAVGKIFGLAILMPLLLATYSVLTHPTHPDYPMLSSVLTGAIVLLLVGSQLAQGVMRRRLREFAQRQAGGRTADNQRA